MRMIHVVLPKAVAFLLGVAAIQAQGQQPAMVGMPDYGVTLSGSPENPIIENHSGKVVIGYEMKFADANGRGPGINQLVAENLAQPAGIPDGGSLYAIGAMPLNPTVPMPSPARAGGHGPIARAILLNVIFADGHFVGVDEHGVSFELFSQKIKAFTEVGILAKTGAWDQLDALAISPGSRLGPPPSGEDPRTLIVCGWLTNADLLAGF